MEQHDVIIVGAGAAGFSAALQLVRSGWKVCILEARNRIGGRIWTIEDFSAWPLEAGAEFVHGDLSTTLDMLRWANLHPVKMEGSFAQVQHGKWKESNDFFQKTSTIVSRLKQLKEDMSMAQFVKFHLQDMDADIKQSLIAYIEGYDSADPERASALAFLEQWQREDNIQYRVQGGYGALLNKMLQEVQAQGGKLLLNQCVTTISWRQNYVVVKTSFSEFRCEQVLVTIPLGLWQAQPSQKGFIEFNPALPRKTEAASKLGYGAVIKFALLFSERFWTSKHVKGQTAKAAKNFAFLTSDERVPTWWTQSPKNVPLLTGWLAGPGAYRVKDHSEDQLLAIALASLRSIFGVSTDELTLQLRSHKIFNWTNDCFARGAYAYATVDRKYFKKQLAETIDGTLFFAGEALQDSTGTVEAALISGQNAAREISERGS